MSTEITRSLHARLHGRRGTIRSRILVAFLAIGMITATLGAYAIYGIRNAGTLVTKTFDETLMSINYARAAAADFAAIQAAFLRRETNKDEKARAILDDQIEKLIDTLNDDLAVAAERSHSKRATEAAANVKEAAATWSKLRTKLHENAAPPDAWVEIDRYAETVNQQIDLLVNYTAGDGFLYRQEALETVARDVRLNMIGTALALLLAAIVSWLLAKRIIGPVAVASRVAKRIADGDLDVTIPVGAHDELGALLESMGTMRDNILSVAAVMADGRRIETGKRARKSAEMTHFFMIAELNRLPRITTNPALSASGRPYGRITFSSAMRASRYSSPIVLPVTVRACSFNRPCARSWPITAGTPPAR